MRKLSSPSFLAAGLLPFTIAACTESFTASGGSGGGGTTTSAGGTTTTATTTSMGGDTGTGGSTGGATGGTSTGGATGGTTSTTGGTGGVPECMSKADCGPHQTCTNGQCVCEIGFTDCSGACVNTMTDPMSCGACGTTCGYSCVGGVCNDPVDLAAGGGTTCAVLALGQLYCWGRNDAGEFGSGAGAGASLPVQVTGLAQTPVKRVYIGKSGDTTHVCATTENGTLYCWGSNQFGKVGTGLMDVNAIAPVTKVTGSPATSSVGLGAFHSVSISNGDLLGWGVDDVGQLGYFGIGTITPNSMSEKQGEIVAAGGAHTCLISGNKLLCFGRNQEGQVGIGSTGAPVLPTEINLGGQEPSGIALGEAHTCVRTSSNTARCWGANGEGQLGLGNNNMQTAPGAAVNTGGVAVSAVFAGMGHTGAIAGENLYLWGRNAQGQVSPTTVTNSILNPVKVGNLHVVTKAALGTQHTCVLDKDGTAVSVYCWGGNGEGQLGQNSIGGDHVPAQKVAFPAP